MEYISLQKLKELKQELEVLREKRTQIAKRIHDAQEMGDLSENAEYAAAKEAQAFNEGKIQKIKRIMKE